tara:strand:- start:1909 stop:2496 length:588 start_codon:yes stop_codon:yes gene_type:complete
MWSELEKIAQGGGTPTAGGATAPAGELEGTVQTGAMGTAEASPSHGIVAARVEQLGDKKARGTPIIQPPPGFVFAPELQAFKPEEGNPAWMTAEQAGEAAQAKSFFEQGAQASQQLQAQREMDTRVQQEAQQAVQAQQAQQQNAAEQQAMQAANTKAVANQQARQQAKDTAASLKSPDSIVGGGAEKGVTVKIGK